MSGIAILILAAGSSSRMAGRDKLMEPVEGAPLLQVLCRKAALTALPCYVCVPDETHPRVGATGSARIIPVPEAKEGMGASIRTGVSALPESCDGVMILPADMPDLGTQDLLFLASHFKGPDGPILRACASDGTPGHPVLFPRRCFEGLMRLTGDEGARRLLQDEAVHLLPLPENRALTDLDTPEAWAAWRSGNQT